MYITLPNAQVCTQLKIPMTQLLEYQLCFTTTKTSRRSYMNMLQVILLLNSAICVLSFDQLIFNFDIQYSKRNVYHYSLVYKTLAPRYDCCTNS